MRSSQRMLSMQKPKRIYLTSPVDRAAGWPAAPVRTPWRPLQVRQYLREWLYTAVTGQGLDVTLCFAPSAQGRPGRHQRQLRHGASSQKGSWTPWAQGTGPSRSKGNDRNRPLRPGHIQPQAMDADTRPGLASLYALPEEHHLLRPGQHFVSRPDTAWIGQGTASALPKPSAAHPAGGLVRRAGGLDHPHRLGAR